MAQIICSMIVSLETIEFKENEHNNDFRVFVQFVDMVNEIKHL